MSAYRSLIRTIRSLRSQSNHIFSYLVTARGCDSPYWDDPVGQRRYRRIPMHREPADLYIQHGSLRAIIPIRLLDLSAGGARISAAEFPALSHSTEVTLATPLPDGGHISGVRAIVVWSERGLVETMAGLEFIALAASERRRIQASIDDRAAMLLSA